MIIKLQNIFVREGLSVTTLRTWSSFQTQWAFNLEAAGNEMMFQCNTEINEPVLLILWGQLTRRWWRWRWRWGVFTGSFRITVLINSSSPSRTTSILVQVHCPQNAGGLGPKRAEQSEVTWSPRAGEDRGRFQKDGHHVVTSSQSIKFSWWTSERHLVELKWTAKGYHHYDYCCYYYYSILKVLKSSC